MKYVHPSQKTISLRAEQGHIIEKPATIEIRGKRQEKDVYHIQIGGNAVFMGEGTLFI